MSLNLSGGSVPGLWNDSPCTGTLPFICEAPAGAPPAVGCQQRNVDALDFFFFCSDWVTFDQASAACTSMGGLLARDHHRAFHDAAAAVGVTDA